MKPELKIVKVDSLANGSMASIDRENGILYLNNEKMSKLSRKQQEFVILHEFAHYELDTSDELAADCLAAQIYFAEYGNLSEPLKIHKQIMSPYHERVLALQRFKPSELDNFGALAGISAGSNMLNGLFSIFTSKQQGRDARALQSSYERQSKDANASAIELARIQLQNIKEGGVLGLQNTQILIVGAIVLAIVIGLVLVLKDIID